MDKTNSTKQFLFQHKKTLLLIIIVSTLTMLISSAVAIWLSDFHNLTLPTLGTIKTVGVEAYWDPELENRTATINWQTIRPGSTKNITLYVRSVSNVKTVLNTFTSDISPPGVSKYLHLSSDYDGKLLNPGEVIHLTLFLSFSDDESFILYTITNEVTDFTVDIHLVANEQTTIEIL